MGDSAKEKTIRFDSVPQTSRFDSLQARNQHKVANIMLWGSEPEAEPCSCAVAWTMYEGERGAEGNALCQTQNPLHSPHQGFWTLVLKLLDQYTEAMTGRPALQQSC